MFTFSRSSVQTLIQHNQIPEVRTALIRLGEIAVPVLADRAASGHADFVDVLYEIGTRKAAAALVPLLKSRWPKVTHQTAFALGALISREDIHEAIGPTFPGGVHRLYYLIATSSFEASAHPTNVPLPHRLLTPRTLLAVLPLLKDDQHSRFFLRRQLTSTDPRNRHP